jgi:glutamyl-tRNA reductase
MELAVIGINFRTAPLEVRERFSFPAAAAQAALVRLQAALPGHEQVLLSTCNRTELIVAVLRGSLDVDAVTRLFLGDGSPLPSGLAEHVFVKRGQEAIEHVMSVATSLDSLVVGETEILGQVKQAYCLAVEAKATGKVLNSLLQQVLRVAKRVRAETGLSEGRVSVGSISVELAGKVFSDLCSKTVIIIGAGKIGEQVLKCLLAKGVTECYVVNRSVERAILMADRYGTIAVPYEKLEEQLPRADIVISSTSAPQCIVGATAVRAAMKKRHNRPVLMVDLAVPRDIEEEVGTIDNVYLYNIDDLEHIAGENLAKRGEAVGAARAIIQAEAGELTAAFRADSLGLGAIMTQLDRSIAEIEEAELARGFAKERVAPLGDACDACREEICQMLHRALAKMAAGPRKALHRAAREGRLEELASLMEQMYGAERADSTDESEEEV